MTDFYETMPVMGTSLKEFYTPAPPAPPSTPNPEMGEEEKNYRHCEAVSDAVCTIRDWQWFRNHHLSPATMRGYEAEEVMQRLMQFWIFKSRTHGTYINKVMSVTYSEHDPSGCLRRFMDTVSDLCRERGIMVGGEGTGCLVLTIRKTNVCYCVVSGISREASGRT